ncbi:MAG TPA: sulfotransferase, partial [Longimicrobiales bacterium]
LTSDYISSWRAGAALRASWQNVERYCVFVGYPSSGHSLFGALLDAHPEIMLSHELDALKYVAARFSRDQLYALILQRGRAFIDSGGIWNKYDYLVEGQWQGRFTNLRVIGDKKGGLSALQIRENPHILKRLQDMVGVPIAVIHMTRNPYDVMATRFQRHREGKDFDWYVDRFFEHCEGVQIARDLVDDDHFYDVRHEDVVANTQHEVARACGFLGLTAPSDYLEACAAKVFESPRRTRASAPWTPELLRRAESRMESFSFLRGYTYDN